MLSPKEDQWTPDPWINVIANKNDFGFILTENTSRTWSINSRENKSHHGLMMLFQIQLQKPFIFVMKKVAFSGLNPTPDSRPEHYLIRHGQATVNLNTSLKAFHSK